MRTLNYLIPILLCLYTNAFGQSLATNRSITVHYKDAKIKDVLVGLESKYQVKFYYANNLVPLYTRVSVHLKNQPLQTVLEEIFRTTDVSFVVLEDKIVLKKRTAKPTKKQMGKEAKKQSFEVPPVKESEVLASAEVQGLQPAFTLLEVKSVPIVEEDPFAGVEKLAIQDTGLPSPERMTRQKNRLTKRYMAKMDSLSKIGDEGGMEELKSKFAAALKRWKSKIQVAADSIKRRTSPKQSQKDSTKLISPLQTTFVYPLGTNGHLAQKVTNKVSLNVLTGYAYALEGVEVGGLVNVEKAYMKGVQAAGIANIVQGEANGVQFAGAVNVVSGMANGAQFAGIATINRDSTVGVQASGILNANRGSLDGAQLAGVVNVNGGSAAGFQAAGVANINGGPSRGAQVAGVLNFSKEEHNGVQIAGIFNQAKRVRGTQIGLINVADTVTGATIGVFNFVKNGYNKWEIFGSEGLYANIGFRFGSRKFHTIVAVGAQPSNDATQCLLAYGAGFGSRLPLSQNMALHLDLMAHHINEGYETYTDKLNLLNQFKAHVEFKLAEHLRLFAGPTFNVMVSNFRAPNGAYGSQLVKNTFFDETYSENKERDPVNVKMWVGFNAGIRF